MLIPFRQELLVVVLDYMMQLGQFVASETDVALKTYTP
jgi:hypothetical protein